MRIATFNVNGVNGRLPNLLAWLGETAPDVVCLQELKAPQDKFPEAAIRAAGYGVIRHGQSRWNGVAILARGRGLIETRRGLPNDPDPSQSRYLEAAIDGVLVGCLYLPNPNPARRSTTTWLGSRRLPRMPRAWSTIRIRWCWRATTTPSPPRPMSGALDRRRLVPAQGSRRLCGLLVQGWTGALRSLRPGERIFTFWDYWRNAWGRDAGLRIDHLLLNPAAAERLADAQVDTAARAREKASDHAPTWSSCSPRQKARRWSSKGG